MRKYKQLAQREKVEFVPFVMESFGGMGKAASAFLKRVAKVQDAKWLVAKACRRLSVSLQKGNALVMKQGCQRAFYRQHRGHAAQREGGGECEAASAGGRGEWEHSPDE